MEGGWLHCKTFWPAVYLGHKFRLMNKCMMLSIQFFLTEQCQDDASMLAAHWPRIALKLCVTWHVMCCPVQSWTAPFLPGGCPRMPACHRWRGGWGGCLVGYSVAFLSPQRPSLSSRWQPVDKTTLTCHSNCQHHSKQLLECTYMVTKRAHRIEPQRWETNALCSLFLDVLNEVIWNNDLKRFVFVKLFDSTLCFY